MKTKTLAYYYYYFKIILVLFKLLSWIHFFFSKRFILVTVAILSLGLNPGWDANPEHIHAVMPVHLLACLCEVWGNQRTGRKPWSSNWFLNRHRACSKGHTYRQPLKASFTRRTYFARDTLKQQQWQWTPPVTYKPTYVLVFQLKRWYYLAAWQSWDTLTSIYCWQTLWERNQKCSTLVLRFVCTIIETLTLIWMNVDLQLLL